MAAVYKWLFDSISKIASLYKLLIELLALIFQELFGSDVDQKISGSKSNYTASATKIKTVFFLFLYLLSFDKEDMKI